MEIFIVLVIIAFLCFLRARNVYEKQKKLQNPKMFAKALEAFIWRFALIFIPLILLFGILMATRFSRGNPKDYIQPIDSAYYDSISRNLDSTNAHN